MIDYDESFFRVRADDLYYAADTVQGRAAFRASLFGLILGLAIAVGLNLSASLWPEFADAGSGAALVVLGPLGAGALGAVIGWKRGRKAADLLRYQAQEILWKVQLERNTRIKLEERAAAESPLA